MKWYFKTLLLLIAGNAFGQHTVAGDTIKPRDIYAAGIGIHYGFVFAHSKAVKNTEGARPWAIETDISRQLLSNKAWAACRCFPRTGLVISYFNFDSKILGHSINAAWYVEPFISTMHRINLSMKGAAGVSYLTNPYHAEKNPGNMSYSTRFASYLALGLGANVKVTEHITVKISAYYNHISNGGIKEPNKGINWPAATAHVLYIINPAALPVTERKSSAEYKLQPLRKDLWMLASKKGHYFILGGGGGISRQISGMNALTLGAEIIADYPMRERMKQDSLYGKSYILAGLLAGHEFLMGKFIFSQQMAVYLTHRGPYYDLLYQRYGLSYAVTKNIYIGINLKAHRQVANFFDGRIIYSFQ